MATRVSEMSIYFGPGQRTSVSGISAQEVLHHYHKQIPESLAAETDPPVQLAGLVLSQSTKTTYVIICSRHI